MRFFITLLFVIGISWSASAQIFLKLYIGSGNDLEYFIGDELHFQVKGEDIFNSFEIIKFDHNSQTVYFPAGQVKLEDIVAIKSYANYKTANVVEKLLYTFGTGWAAFSVFDIFYRGEDVPRVARDGAIVAGGAFLGGFLIKKFWSTRVYPLDTEEYLLRIIDLTIN